MITAPTVWPHVVLARKWGHDFMACSHMSKWWGRGPADCECGAGLRKRAA